MVNSRYTIDIHSIYKMYTGCILKLMILPKILYHNTTTSHYFDITNLKNNCN